MSGEVPDSPVAQVAARLVSNEPVGAYRHLVLDAAAVAAPARPGQFVAVAVGGDDTAHLLRRCFSIHRVDPDAGTVELVVADAGAGTHWLVGQQPGAIVDVVGPLGTPFPLPEDEQKGGCVLVGGGYGSAPLGWLAERLRADGRHVELVLGAATADRLFGVEAGRRTADAVSVTTDDGSAGTKGWVSDVLPDVIVRSSATTLYACGPMAMLRSVTDVAAAHGAVAHVAVEEAMACGIGICMTCVMPVVQDDGTTRMVRSCLEGPVFRGDTVRWEAFADGRCTVPADAVGAPAAAGGGGH